MTRAAVRSPRHSTERQIKFSRAGRAVQRRTPCRHKRGREWFEKPLETYLGVSLRRDERAVDRGQGEARELVGGRAVRIVTEREADLPPQQPQGAVADPADDRPDLPPLPVRRLRGEDDEQAQEIRVTLQRADRGRDDPGEVLRRTTSTSVPLG